MLKTYIKYLFPISLLASVGNAHANTLLPHFTNTDSVVPTKIVMDRQGNFFKQVADTNQDIYESTDGGKTWSQVSTPLGSSALLIADNLNYIAVWSNPHSKTLAINF